MQVTHSTPCAPKAITPGASAGSAGAEPGAFARLLSAHQRPAQNEAKPARPEESRPAPSPRRPPSAAGRDTPPAREASSTEAAEGGKNLARQDGAAQDEDETVAPPGATVSGTPPPALTPELTPEQAPELAAAWAAASGAPLDGTPPSKVALGKDALRAQPTAATRAVAGGPQRSVADIASASDRVQAPDGETPDAPALGELAGAPASPRFAALLQGAEHSAHGDVSTLAAAAGTSTAPLHDHPTTPVAAARIDMPTPATSPEFRQALGVQISVLARDGVQHAELHLHPADMGPIQVHIALEGSRAHVDFGVESSATRSLIESGLPELAAALRDAGFTLSGGGVSQHANRQPGDQPPSTRDHGTATPAREAAPRRVTARLAQGAVDLYA